MEKCAKFMQKIVAEMVTVSDCYILAFEPNLFIYFCNVSFQVENSFSVSVPIFKQFHRNIIGKGGSNIKKVISNQERLTS